MPARWPLPGLWLFVLSAGTAMFLLWRFVRESEVLPASPNPFICELAVQRIDTASDVRGLIEIPVNSGFCASISFVPADDRPEVLDGREVRNPDEWPMTLVLYPRGSDAESNLALHSSCNRFERPGKKPRLVPSSDPPPHRPFQLGGMPGYWWTSGYKAPPKAQEPWPLQEVRFWTYFAAPTDRPVDYVYELTLFPTCHWVSNVRYDVGPGVVLQRGLLRILPKPL